jgi:predicted dehydrogenase
MAKIRWGVLSTASIGRALIEASRAATHAEVVGVASRDAGRPPLRRGPLPLGRSRHT